MKLSIIVPCYNHGIYLQDALDSVRGISTPYDYEIIIVNDGSDDPFTLQKLSQLELEGYNVLHQENKGLAAARNYSIANAKGEYIIPLDSDNKLHELYLTKAVDILEEDASIDVVYSNCQFFGGRRDTFNPEKFDLLKILEVNRVDACTVIRKSTLQKAGGYDGNMPVMGNEDWELWVNIYLNNGNFFYLNDIGFYYRVAKGSMSETTTRQGLEANRSYILKKHADKLFSYYKLRMDEMKRLQRQELKKLEYVRNNRLKAAVKLVLGKPI